MKALLASLLMATASLNTLQAQAFGDEGPSLKPNRLGLVYEQAIERNVPGQVNVHRVTYKIDGIDAVANVYPPEATHIKTYYVPEFVDQITTKLRSVFQEKL